MENILNMILDFVGQFSVSGYFFIFIIAFLESLAFIGLVVPGVILIALIGFLSANSDASVPLLLFYAFLGSFLGDSLSFFMGRKGALVFKGRLSLWALKYVERGEEFIDKHCYKSILLGRFIGPMRPVVPFLAGVLNLKIKQFLLWDLVSSLLWAAFYLLLGYYGGKIWQAVGIWPKNMAYIVLLFFAIVLFFYFFKILIKKYASNIRGKK